jgi:hypothetical protein
MFFISDGFSVAALFSREITLESQVNRLSIGFSLPVLSEPARGCPDLGLTSPSFDPPLLSNIDREP